MEVKITSKLKCSINVINSVYTNRLRLGVSGYSQLFLYSLLLSNSTYTYAGPVGGNVIGGSGTISQSGLITTINQKTSSLAINWNSYNISSNEVVNYIQPTSSAIALNRILSNSASQILGQINANGQVVLINPNGIFFGSDSSINVGSLIASGLDISPSDFMNGEYIFNEVLGTDGTVINSGLINASLGGNVALLGKQVTNEGVISAQLGSVNLAAGKSAVLTFDQQGLLGIQVTEAILQDEIGVDPAVLNNGEINAEGGRVLLTASVSQDVFSQAVNAGDIEQATSVVVNEDGTFTLGAGADVVNTGTIDVSTTSVDQDAGTVIVLGENVTSSGIVKADAVHATGGEIEFHASNKTILDKNSLTSAISNTKDAGIIKVLGDKVGLFDTATIKATGYSNGGDVLIGGDFQGKNQNIQNATVSYIDQGVTINASSEYLGDGGTVIQWADNTARYYGTIVSKGGRNGGNGGFAEVSGKEFLDFNGDVNLSSIYGRTGTLLLDPRNITIENGGSTSESYLNNNDAFSNNSTSSVTFDADLITDILTGSNGKSLADVVLEATADIWVREAIDISGTTGNTSSLTLNAGDDIEVDAVIKLEEGTLTLTHGHADCGTATCLVDSSSSNQVGVLNENNQGTDSFEKILDLDASISTNGGDIVLGSTVDSTKYIRIGNGSNTINISTGDGSVAGDINFKSAVESDDGTDILNLTAGTGTVTFDTSAGGGTSSTALGELNILSASTVNLNAVNTGNKIDIVAPAINLSGNLLSTRDGDAGDISLTGNVFLKGDIQVNSAGSNSDGLITITGDINDDGVGLSKNLDLLSDTNDIIINGDIGTGAGNAIQSLNISSAKNVNIDAVTTKDDGVSITAANNIDLGGDLSSNAGTNGGDINITGAATLSANVSINTNTTGTDGIVDFSSTIDSNPATTTLRTLNIDAGNSTDANTSIVNIQGAIGSSQALQGLFITDANDITLVEVTTDSGGLTANGATLDLNGAINTNGGLVDLDSINNLVLNNSISTSDGDVFINVSTGSFSNNSGGGTINSGSGDVSIASAGSSGGRGVNLGDITTTGTGALSVTATGGTIAQATSSRNLVIGGSSSFDAGTYSIALNNTNNDFTGDVSFATSAEALVIDVNALVLGVSNITNSDGSGDLNVTALDGGITQLDSSGLTVDGVVTFDSSNGDIIVDNVGNDFRDVVNIVNTGASTATEITIRDDNDITIGTTSLSGGTYTVNAASDINLVTSINPNGSSSLLVLNAGNNINLDIDALTGTGLLAQEYHADVDTASGGQINLNANLTSGGGDVLFDGAVALHDGVTASTLTTTSIDAGTGAITFNGLLDGTNSREQTLDLIGGDIYFHNNVGSGIRLNAINITASGEVIAETTDVIPSRTSITASSFNVNASNLFRSGSINTVGDTDTVGGAVSVNAFTDLSVSSIDSHGGATSGGNVQGQDGGDISLAAADITVGTLQSYGSDATGTTDNNGGAAGSININATDDLASGTPSITLNGDVDTHGGVGAIATSSDGLSSITQINLLGSSDPSGTVTLNYGSDFTSALNIVGKLDAEQVVGSDTLIAAPNRANAWDIDGNNSGTLNGNITFSNIENLTGNNGIDTFSYLNTGSLITGRVDGGDGLLDTVNLSNLLSVSVDLSNTGNFTGIETYTGNDSASTLTGENQANIWTIDGANTGQITNANGVVNFIGFSDLVGNDLVDEFTLTNNGSSISGSIAGGGFNGDGVTDTLTIHNAVADTVDWNITGVNQGSVTGINDGIASGFFGIEQLAGGDQVDTFTFQNTGVFDGDIDAANGIDIIDLSNLTTATFSLASGFNGRFNFEQVRGNSTDSTLIGDDVTNIWDVDGENTGVIGSLRFIDFNNLTGGSIQDTFNFITNSANITGLIDGGGSSALADTLDIAGISSTQATTIQLDSNAGTTPAEILTINSNNILDIANIGQIDANSNLSNTLLGGDNPNIWIITNERTGTVNSTGFSGFSVLTGGLDTDNFSFINSNLSGLFEIDGGSGPNTIIGSGIDISWDITDTNAGTINDTDGNIDANTNINVHFLNIDSLTGSDSNSDVFTFISGATNGSLDGTINGGSGLIADTIINRLSTDTNWIVNGTNQGNISGVLFNFTGIENLTGSDLVKDTFNLETGASISGLIFGGANTTDEIVNQSSTAYSWNITSTNQGDVSGVGNFADIENLTGSSTANDTFNLYDAGSIDGIVNGGSASGDEIVSYLTADTSWNITNINQGNVAGINSFIGVENLTGANDVVDTFSLETSGVVNGSINGGTGAVLDIIANMSSNGTTWNITGGDQGNIFGIVNDFSGIESLTGSDFAIDVFNLATAGSISGVVSGGTNSGDEVVNQSMFSTTWNITGSNEGNIAGEINAFNGIENLTGSDNAIDIFNLAQAGVISEAVNGGTGVGDEIISQRSTSTSWNISSADTGNVTGIALFSDIENLTGNNQDDTFTYANGSSISGVVNGGDLLISETDADVVDMSSMLTPLDVVLGADFQNIETFIGNTHADSTITASNLDNEWRIYNVNNPTSASVVTNQGTITDSNLTTTTFISFNNITGGSGVDNFLIESNGDIDGVIDGGSGTDYLDLSSQSGVIDKTVGDSLGLSSFTSVEGIKGNGTESILRVADGADSTWTIDGINSGTVTSGSNTTIFTDFNILQGGDRTDVFNVTVDGGIGDQLVTDLVSRINGGAGNDQLIVDLSGSLSAKVNLFAADGLVSNDGNRVFSNTTSPGGNDTVTINGASANFDTATYSVDYTSGVATHTYRNISPLITASVAYSDVEAVTDSVQASNLIVTSSGDNNTVTLSGNGNVGEGSFIVENFTNSFAEVDYLNKANLTVVNSGLSGIIDIASDLELDSVIGYFDFTSDQIRGSSLLTANELRLDSVSVNVDPNNSLQTDVNSLRVENSTADIYVMETNGLNLEQTDTTGLLSVISATGNIGDSDVQGLISNGDLTLMASNGDILLDNVINALTGIVSLNTGSNGSATLNNSGATTATNLGGSNVGAGTLTVTSVNADILSTDALIAATAVLDAGNNDISLTNVDFDTVSVSNAHSLTVVDADEIEFAGVLLGSGELNVTSTGISQQVNTSIIQTANPFLGTASLVSIDARGGTIDLGNAANDFVGDVSLVNTGASNVQITDVNQIQFGQSAIGSGLFTVNAGSGITQTGEITQEANAGLTTFNAGNGVITLDNVLNSFTGSIALNNTDTSSVSLTNSNVIDFGGSSVGGSFDIVATGDITQSAAISVVGDAEFTTNAGQNIQLDEPANNFQGDISFVVANGLQLLDVSIANNNDLNILGDINVAGDLNVFANGSIGSVDAVKVGGVTWFDSSANTVTLENVSNDFNDIVLVDTGTVTITDTNGINLGTLDTNPSSLIVGSSVTGDLTLTTQSGDITDVAGSALVVSGTSTLSAGSGLGNIVLDEAANDFSVVDIANANNVTIVDVNGIDLKSTTINGNLDVTAGNNVSNLNGALNVTGLSSFTAATGSDVILNDINNHMAGTISFAAVSGRLSNISLNNTVATNVDAVNVTNDLTIVSGGELTQTGGFDVGNTTTLTAIDGALSPQDITMDTFVNNLNTLVVTNAHDVRINNSGNALTINELNATGVVDIVSGSLVATSDITGTSVMLDAGSDSIDLASVTSTGNVSINSVDLSVSGDITGTDIFINADSGNTGVGSATFAGDITSTSEVYVAAAGILTNGVITANSNIGLDATSDDAVINNTITSNTGDVTVVADNIVQNGDINADANIALNSNQSITMNSAVTTESVNGSIEYAAINNVNVSLLSATNNSVTVTSASGAIIDANSGTNFISNRLTLEASSGIGGGDALETQVSVMDITNTGTGDIRLSQNGDVEFEEVTNLADNALVDIRSDGDFSFNPGSVDANRANGTLFMSTTGDFKGIGRVDMTNADITAYSATFISLSGAFGSPTRPIVLDVPTSGSVLIDTRTTAFVFNNETPNSVISTGIDISALGVVSAVAGEQLVEIESLGDIDPAIFTDLRNFSLEEVSIRMPRDQLFEDELEEYSRL